MRTESAPIAWRMVRQGGCTISSTIVEFSNPGREDVIKIGLRSPRYIVEIENGRQILKPLDIEHEAVAKRAEVEKAKKGC